LLFLLAWNCTISVSVLDIFMETSGLLYNSGHLPCYLNFLFDFVYRRERERETGIRARTAGILARGQSLSPLFPLSLSIAISLFFSHPFAPFPPALSTLSWYLHYALFYLLRSDPLKSRCGSVERARPGPSPGLQSQFRYFQPVKRAFIDIFICSERAASKKQTIKTTTNKRWQSRQVFRRLSTFSTMVSYHLTCYLRVITEESVLYNFFQIWLPYWQKILFTPISAFFENKLQLSTILVLCEPKRCSWTESNLYIFQGRAIKRLL